MHSALTCLLLVAYAAGSPMLVDNLHDSELKQLFGVDNLENGKMLSLFSKRFLPKIVDYKPVGVGILLWIHYLPIQELNHLYLLSV